MCTATPWLQLLWKECRESWALLGVGLLFPIVMLFTEPIIRKYELGEVGFGLALLIIVIRAVTRVAQPPTTVPTEALFPMTGTARLVYRLLLPLPFPIILGVALGFWIPVYYAGHNLTLAVVLPVTVLLASGLFLVSTVLGTIVHPITAVGLTLPLFGYIMDPTFWDHYHWLMAGIVLAPVPALAVWSHFARNYRFAAGRVVALVVLGSILFWRPLIETGQGIAIATPSAIRAITPSTCSLAQIQKAMHDQALMSVCSVSQIQNGPHFVGSTREYYQQICRTETRAERERFYRLWKQQKNELVYFDADTGKKATVIVPWYTFPLAIRSEESGIVGALSGDALAIQEWTFADGRLRTITRIPLKIALGIWPGQVWASPSPDGQWLAVTTNMHKFGNTTANYWLVNVKTGSTALLSAVPVQGGSGPLSWNGDYLDTPGDGYYNVKTKHTICFSPAGKQLIGRTR